MINNQLNDALTCTSPTISSQRMLNLIVGIMLNVLLGICGSINRCQKHTKKKRLNLNSFYGPPPHTISLAFVVDVCLARSEIRKTISNRLPPANERDSNWNCILLIDLIGILLS